jgi:hypothetical protein
MTKYEWRAYIIYEKLGFIFNRRGIVYTGDLIKLANERKHKKVEKAVVVVSRFELMDFED